MGAKNIFLRFPGGKPKALTFSYDDGLPPDERLIDMFNKAGVKGTFNLNSCRFNLTDDESKRLKNLYKGHEIAIHMYDHPLMNAVNQTELTLQIIKDRRCLEEIFGGIIDGMAYPYGLPEEVADKVSTSMQACEIKYSRVTAPTKKFKIPNNWYKWQPTCHHNHPELLNLADDFVNTDVNCQKQVFPYLFYVWGHSYEFENQDNWDLMQNLLDTVSNKEDIWYATNIEIYNYCTAFEKLRFNVSRTLVFNPTSYDIWFRCNNNDYIIKSGEYLNI